MVQRIQTFDIPGGGVCHCTKDEFDRYILGVDKRQGWRLCLESKRYFMSIRIVLERLLQNKRKNMADKISFNEQVNDLEIQDHNNAMRMLAYHARTNREDIEKLESALDLFKSLNDKLSSVDELTTSGIKELSQEFAKARGHFIDQKGLIVGNAISGEKIAANTITAAKLKIADLI